jgi:outer membrane protein assembly factor BamE|tara:strand:+ start:3461 stop:3787 length:327 start_codon:yes stop_codon:yes gene_type:complete
MNSIFNLIIILLVILLQSCSLPKVYEVIISQGNLIDEEMMSKLEVGMSPSQVKYVLGTPLLTDTFSPDRWDYYTAVSQGDIKFTEKKVALFFVENKLDRWEEETLNRN